MQEIADKISHHLLLLQLTTYKFEHITTHLLRLLLEVFQHLARTERKVARNSVVGAVGEQSEGSVRWSNKQSTEKSKVVKW